MSRPYDGGRDGGHEDPGYGYPAHSAHSAHPAHGDGGERPTWPLPRLDPKAAAGIRRHRFRRLAYRAVLAAGSLLACAAIGFGLLLALTPSAGEATAIAARLARQRGIPYPGPQVPANFSRPLIATEDHRFYAEPGIDPFAVARLAVGTVTGHPGQGGATIEQQLAKMLYFAPGQGSLLDKAKQAALGVKINFMYSKAEILRLYAETAYYGHGFYGLQAASCGYFAHPPADLTVTQGAMLAGVVNAPSQDDPISHPAQARARLEHVTGRLVAVGDLTAAQGAAAARAPLRLAPGASLRC